MFVLFLVVCLIDFVVDFSVFVFWCAFEVLFCFVELFVICRLFCLFAADCLFNLSF